MPPNAPIDSSIGTTALAFYNQLWNLWQAGKHVSGAWTSIVQVGLPAQGNGDQSCEWRLYKKTTGHAPAMFCLNGNVQWAQNGSVKNNFGAPLQTIPNSFTGCLRLMQGVAARGGAVQYLQPGACPALYVAGSTYSGAATTVAGLGSSTLGVASTAPFTTGLATPVVNSVVSQGTAGAGAVFTVSSVVNIGVGTVLTDTTSPGAIPAGASVVNVSGSTVTITPGVTALFVGDQLTNGHAVILAADGLHPFDYTGTTGSALNIPAGVTSQPASNLNGNVAQSSGAAVAAGAVVLPASLQQGTSGVLPAAGLVNGTSYVSEAWPLHWSSSAWSTLSAAQPAGGGIAGATATGWADAQAVNANGNLNAILECIVNLANAIAPAPLLLRPMAESNGGGGGAGQFWYSEANFSWGAQLFKYIVGYLTGNHGFAGQPSTASPPHNILFAVNPLTGATGAIGTDFPTAANTGLVADICGLDHYSTWSAAAPSASFTTAQGITGYANTVPMLFEAFTNGAANFNPYASPANSEFGVDLHGASSFVTLNNYDTTHRSFAASGTLQVLTSNGVQSVSYSSFSTTGVNPNKIATFVISSTAGVPVGSIVDTSSQIINFLTGGYCSAGPSTGAPSTAANFILGVKDATAGGCHFVFDPMNYGGFYTAWGQGVEVQAGCLALFQDAATVNLPTPGNWSVFQWGQGEGTEWNWSAPLIGVVP